MPTSFPVDMRVFAAQLAGLEPGNVLDIGVGFGRWGFACREFLDIFQGRYDKADWRVVIDGIEVYEPYIAPHHRYIYDNIFIGDAAELITTVNPYDVIIVGDMLEHLPRKDAWAFFHNIMAKTRKGFFLNLPLGGEWDDQVGVFENRHEDHKSTWELSDFSGFYPEAATTDYGRGKIHASMLFTPEGYRYGSLMEEAAGLEKSGDAAMVREKYAAAVKLDPKRPAAHLALAHGLYQAGDAAGALAALRRMLGDAECSEAVRERAAAMIKSITQDTG